jgi:hypothetical protein
VVVSRIDLLGEPRSMGGARKTPDSAAAQHDTASAEAARKAGNARGSHVPRNVLALQRSAGNAAVNALLAARMRSPGDPAVADIDAALREVRQGDPVVDTVEKGLKAAKAAGVPVDLEGTKPPASALAVTRTGFGPDAVPTKKPVPPPKPVPKASPLGKAGAKPAKGAGGSGAAGPALGGVPTAMPASPAGGVTATSAGAPGAHTSDQLLAPPVPPPGVRPAADPSFRQVTSSVKGVAAARKAHSPASVKAKEAQDAASPPADDLAGQAKAAKIDTMDAQQAGTFDKKAFIAAVKTAIEAKSPKTLKEADDYKKSGKAGEVKGEVKGLVTSGTQGQARDIDTATEAPPDQSKAVAKPVTPMAPEEAGPPPSAAAAGAAPKPAPAEQLNLAAGPHEADQEMAQGEVTEQQLAESNEPQFQQALTDKQAAAAHAQTAPTEFRQQEQAVITQHKADATAQATAGVTGMQSSKGAALAALVAAKGKTKTKDEAKRAEVTTKIQGIFTATEADVKKLLDGLDPKVDAAFTDGEGKARQAFESYVDAKMTAYKKDRYGGWLGGLRWAKDKLLGMPEKVNEFYAAGRELYLKQMDGVITKVADVVAIDLTAAKQRIAKGRADIAAYVKSLPADLKGVGSEASKEIGDRFTQLESDVDAKQESVVDTLATKYTEARKGLDERIEALQAENKGLVDKAIGAIKAVINTIRELVSMLTGVLARAAGVIGDIVKAPIKFLGNLIAGVKGGILKFKDNIVDHLRKGLMSWLFGALAEAGVELPDKFDLMGIVKLLASIFGMTWTNIRNRIVKQVGEKAMGAIEKGVEIFSVLRTQGVAGLWQMLLEKLGDIKEMILEQVKDFVITKIITAGITWLIGLLNPAAAFIKACKMIYDIVMFFVDNGSRILKFVNTVIDSVADIVKGNVSGVVNKINDVLGQMVPIIIGFLASLVGLGGIGAKIRSIIETLQKPVTKALNFVIKTGLKLAGPIIRGIKGISGKVKAKVAAGKAWVKGKVEAGKQWAKGKVDAGKAWAKGKITGKAVASGTGPTAALAETDRMLAGKPNHAGALTKVADIGRRHSTPLRLVVEKRSSDGEHVHVQAMATESHVLPAYDPTALTEAALWEHADRTVKLEGETKETRADRAAAARAELARRIGGQATVVLVGHLATKGPRPTRGARGEDTAGGGMGHIAARHVIGQTRIDMAPAALGATVNPDWIAYRAVANVPPCGGMSGGFADAGAAGFAVQAAVSQLAQDWPAFRVDLLTNGRIQRIVPVAGAGVCFVNNQSAPSPALLPTWLGGPTNRKLHRGDVHATDDPPLADTGAPGGTEVRILLNADAPNGWFVHSAWPTI